MNDWITIFETDRLYEAEGIKNLLATNGVAAVVLNQQDSSYHFGTIRVMVNEADREQAAILLKSVQGE